MDKSISNTGLLKTLDPIILGKLLLVQSKLQVSFDDQAISDFLVGCLSEIPGIGGIGACLKGRFYPGNLVLQPEDGDVLQKKCTTCRMKTASLKGEAPVFCPLVDGELLTSIELRTTSDLYGFLLLRKTDAAAYSLYEPYLQNTADLLALLLENREQRNDLVDVRKKLELAVKERIQALAESEEKYAAVVKQASEGIYLLDPYSKQILEFNDAFAKIIGLPDNKVGNLIVYDFVAHPKDDINRIIQHAVSSGNYYIGERQYLRQDGSLIDVESSAKLIRFCGKEILCVIVRDISERKRDEREREQLQDRLRQAQKMEAIGTLAGGIAHDFNNILSAIIGYSELVKMGLPSSSQAVKDIDEIVRSGMRAADLVKQILAFSRKADRTMQVIAPNHIIKEAVKMLRATFPATVTMVEEIDEECGFVLVDPTGLHQIVLNLCTNAFQALPNQKGTIGIRLFRLDGSDKNPAQGPMAVLAVSDSGCGMDKVTVDRIFEPYFTTKAKGKGTGLGLAVVHGIVQDYNGRITVDSVLGEGSTFTVYIPLSDEGQKSIGSFAPEPAPVPASSTKAQRILFVDDELALCSLCERHLKNSGYQVTVTTDSREALAKIRSRPDFFDLLITDQTMPDLTGIELAKEVLDINPMLPIIMCSGHSDIVSEDDALTAGIKRYLFKPFTKKELLDTIREVVENK